MNAMPLRFFRTIAWIAISATCAVSGATPVSPNASAEAKAVLNYLYDQYGKKTLAGQMYAPWGIDEIETVKSYTGKYPAIRGEDLITESANNNEIQLAANWWKAGGIPTIMWHWGAPTKGEGYDNSKATIDVTKCFQTGSAENVAMMADLKRIADHLQVLRDAKVPVLWRPMHESDGGWFWWSKGGGANYVKLWHVMFDYFTKDRGLNNLIWVSCHSGTLKADYDPGVGYYDLAGGDTYASDNNPQSGIFQAVTNIYGSATPHVLHECGILPDPDKEFSQGATWSWWMLWHTTFVENHDKNELKRIYNHDRVITRDELPNWSTLIQATSIQGSTSETSAAAASMNVVRAGDGWSVRCGSGSCGSLSLRTMDGKEVTLETSAGIVRPGVHRMGVHLLRATDGSVVREAKVLLAD
jgi:hypothetical protein